MRDPKNLDWGDTPFDDMTRDEMLHELKVHFNAVMSASSALHILSYHDRESPFWGPFGTGGRALRQVASIIERVNHHRDDGGARVSACYFRYTDELLFPDIEHGPERWWINDDDVMVKTADPHLYPHVGWNQNWRLLTLDDLKPQIVDTEESSPTPNV